MEDFVLFCVLWDVWHGTCSKTNASLLPRGGARAPTSSENSIFSSSISIQPQYKSTADPDMQESNTIDDGNGGTEARAFAEHQRESRGHPLRPPERPRFSPFPVRGTRERDTTASPPPRWPRQCYRRRSSASAPRRWSFLRRPQFHPSKYFSPLLFHFT